MEPRIQDRDNPDVWTGIRHLRAAVDAGGVQPATLALVHLRASQVNGCSACVFATATTARKNGETDERLDNVVAWREAPFYTDGERAALGLAEAATRVQDGAAGVTDEVWAEASEHFDDGQLRSLVLEIALTNFFNRVNHALRQPAGITWS